jgi:hypothetical protein
MMVCSVYVASRMMQCLASGKTTQFRDINYLAVQNSDLIPKSGVCSAFAFISVIRSLLIRHAW